MKVALILGGGANQRALANRLAQHLTVVGIVEENRPFKRAYTSASWWADKLADRLWLRPLYDAWHGMQAHFAAKNPHFPEAPILPVVNVNDPKVVAWLHALKADCFVVSGTGLLRKELIQALPQRSILNLHTGISPYVRGGPNCTNWCLATGNYHLIGNSIMYLSAGIDSGDLLLTEPTPLTGNESLTELQIQVMDHAHDRYDWVITQLADQTHWPAGTPQKVLPKGQLYLSKQWTPTNKAAAIRNHRQGHYRVAFTSGEVPLRREQLELINVFNT